MKQFILVLLVMSFGLSVVFAQGRHRGHKHHHPKLNKEAKAAMHKFHKETVYPVKKAAHDQFLATLSQKDRTFLDQKRVEGKALQQEHRAMHKEMKGLRESGKSKEEMHEMRKEKFAPLRAKRQAFMESMKPFMERNEALIKTSIEPMKENRATWKVKKEAILDQYLSEEEKTKMESCKKERGERGHRGGHHAKKGDKKHEGRRGKGAVQFVLWDGVMKTPKEAQTNGSKKSKTGIESLSETNSFTISTYPNPAISQTTILLKLTEESKKVKVTLTNTEGQQVWVKNYSKLTEGEHQIDVNLQKLVSGQYFYTVEIGEKRITKPFVVNK
jgi:hypothetical protein